MCPLPGISFSLSTSRLFTIIQIFTSGRKQRGTKKPLDEGEKGKWKSWLKTQHWKDEDHGIQPITSWQMDVETMETVTDFIFLGSKSLQMVTAAMKLKDTCSLEEKLLPT